MNDRLQDLYNVRTSKDFSEHELVEVPIDVDYLEVPAGLQTFSEEVENIKVSIVQIKSQIETLTAGYKSVLVAIDSTQQEEKNKQLEEQIELAMKQTAERLKKMGAENSTSTDHVRWRNNVHSHLTKRFMDVMIQYRGLQSEHKEKIQERIRQRLRIVKPDATPEEVQQVLEGGKLNVFAEEINSVKYEQAKDALNYVENRHREILKIENSVNELHRLFCDMAVLVNAQGEYIDNIEANVATSGAYIEAAHKDLVQANKRASKRRWCKIWCIFITIIILAVGITVFIILGKMNNWWGIGK